MTGTPLASPAEIYRPFTRTETARLQAFVTDVRRLGRMRFFEQVPKTAAFSWDGTEARAEMADPDDEALRAAITQFRQIYDHDEPHSFQKTVKLLKQSVHDHGSPLREQAMKDLDRHLEAERRALRAGIGVGIVVESRDRTRKIDPRTIIDAYFHGHYLHSGNHKSALARTLDDLQPWARYTLYSVMLVLRNVYWQAANAVDRPLAVAELLNAD